MNTNLTSVDMTERTQFKKVLFRFLLDIKSLEGTFSWSDIQDHMEKYTPSEFLPHSPDYHLDDLETARLLIDVAIRWIEDEKRTSKEGDA